MTNNVTATNTFATQLKGSIQFNQNGVATFTDSKSEAIYNDLLAVLMKVAETQAYTFISRSTQVLDKDEMVSVALLEGVRKAFDMWYDDKFPFHSVYSRAIKLLFIDLYRTENTAKRIALTNSCPPDVQGEDDEVSLFDAVIDLHADFETDMASTDFLKSIASQLSDDEKKVLYVLSTVTGKEKGQAFAQVFNRDYDASLRKKVERAKKHIAQVVTNAR